LIVWICRDLKHWTKWPQSHIQDQKVRDRYLRVQRLRLQNLRRLFRYLRSRRAAPPTWTERGFNHVKYDHLLYPFDNPRECSWSLSMHAQRDCLAFWLEVKQDESHARLQPIRGSTHKSLLFDC
jgi:hypothetical protein